MGGAGIVVVVVVVAYMRSIGRSIRSAAAHTSFKSYGIWCSGGVIVVLE